MRKIEVKDLLWTDIPKSREDLEEWSMNMYGEVLDNLEEHYHNVNTDDWYYITDELDKKGEYIIIANLGLWKGRVVGYKEITRLNQVLYDKQGYIELGLDAYDLVAVDMHHDGTNYYIIREWKDATTDSQKNKLLDAIYNRRDYKSMLSKYTKSVRADVIKWVFGL